MNILFTGASSFTGMWFVETLCRQGHKVTTLFRSSLAAYQGVRKQRVARVCEYAHNAHFSCPFGSELFLDITKKGPWDLLCHHAAEVTDYKSPHFDPLTAASSNTHQVRQVLKNLSEQGCRQVVLTGSLFEQREGAGSDGLKAFSAYGLSKGLTSDLFAYYCHEARIQLRKFVIPNPFGPYEEPRYLDYLIRTWSKNEIAQVMYPRYVRDNIHVRLLAESYAQFCAGTRSVLHPSGYVESQSAFTERVAQALRSRLGLACEYQCATSSQYSEPMVRINTDLPDVTFDEQAAWEQLADYYRQKYLGETTV